MRLVLLILLLKNMVFQQNNLDRSKNDYTSQYFLINSTQIEETFLYHKDITC